MRVELLEALNGAMEDLKQAIEMVESAEQSLYGASDKAASSGLFSPEDKKTLCEINDFATGFRRFLTSKSNDLDYHSKKVQGMMKD